MKLQNIFSNWHDQVRWNSLALKDSRFIIIWVAEAILILCGSCSAEIGAGESIDSNTPVNQDDGMAIAMINGIGPNGNRDSIETLTYQQGCLEKNQVLVEGIDNPRSMVIRRDSKEALIAYGAVDKPSGVVVLDINPSDNKVSVASTVEFDFQALPNGLSYAGNDEALFMGSVSATIY